VSEGGAERDEEKAWRDIVERWDDEPTTGGSTYDPKPFAGFDYEERFVPPTPGPTPLPEPPRLIAWCGVLGAPVVFLVFLIAGARLPSWASTLLVCAFIGGFVFLVATMRREPRDPGDDGAVV
jgi:hypothetical protein